MKYNRLTQENREDILNILQNSKDVLFGDEISNDYKHDEMEGIHGEPECVVRVHTTQEVSAVVRYANEHRIPVLARGSGSGLVGAAVPIHGGIIIDLKDMNRILELDEDNLTVTIQPGVLLMELAQFATEHGYMYPPDPGEKSATVGGNISTNAGGMRAVKYGVTRDYVRGLTVVLPTGEILTTGGKIVKNSSGYDLKDLFIGAEGTLGIITEAVMKLVPLPAHSISLLIPYMKINDCMDTVPKLIRSGLAPTAIEFMQSEVIRHSETFLGKNFPDKSGDAYLLLTFDGEDQDYLEKQYEAAAELCLECGALDVFLVDTDERKDSVWSARSAFLEAIKASTDMMDECDVVVPRSEIAPFIAYIAEASEQSALRIPYFGHAGDGNLHIYLCRDGLEETEWIQRRDHAFKLLYDHAKSVGGLVSGEHGIGYVKKPYMRESLSDNVLDLMRGIKKVFDPNSIMNPDKLFDLED